MFIVKQPLETLISGNTAEELGITSFHAVNMTQSNTDKGHQETTDTLPETDDPTINTIVRKYSKLFFGIGKCKNRKITLHTKTDAKPCIQPIRPIPFHLRKKIDDTVNDIIKQGVCEESVGPTEWLSNPVIVPKGDGTIRITVDYRNLNKSHINTHSPIPRIEDLRASMNGLEWVQILFKSRLKTGFLSIRVIRAI